MKLLFCFLIVTSYSISQSNKDTIIFSHTSGVYSDSILLNISNLNKDKIYYSKNGDYPSIEYKEPIPLKKSTTIRVKNRNTLIGYTRNFLFPGRKINLPIICITVKPSDLYDSLKGIYVKGLNASKISPYKGANFHKNWERTAYLEFIDTNNKVGFNQKLGIKIFGQFSAMLPQKSFSLHARKKYGKEKIKYPLFPDLPFKKYKSVVLRNSGSDFCSTHFRDIMMTSLVKNFNIETQAYRSCIVYLNGDYWGIYHIREKINEHFIKQHFKLDKDSIAIMKHRSDVQHYGRLNYNRILKFIKKSDLKQDSNVVKLSKLIDIDNYLDYNIAQVYISNIDAGGNIRYWRERKYGAKWRWILFDTDFGFGLRKTNGVEENTLIRFTEYSSELWPFPSWSSLIIRKLLKNESIKKRYIQKFTHYLNTTFKPDNVVNHINAIANNLKPEIPYHFRKWKRQPTGWENNVNYIIDFAERRPGYLFSFLKEKFQLDSSFIIQFNHNSNQGSVFFDSYQVDSGFTGTYFSTINYKLNAEPKFGYEFSHWSNDTINITDKIRLKNNTVVSAFFIKKGNSKYRNQIFINEVGYKDNLLSTYLEIFNATDSVVNISNWVFINGDKKTIIKENTLIQAHSYYTFFKDTTQSNNEILNSQFGLFKIKKRNKIELYSSEEEFIDHVYLDETLLNNSNIIELVNTTIKHNWTPTNQSTINKMNLKQAESNKNNNIILTCFFSIMSLIILTPLFLFFKNRKRRRDNSSK